MLRISNHFVSTATALLIGLDFCLLLGAADAAVSLRFGTGAPTSVGAATLYGAALTFAASMIFSMSALGMYQNNVREGFHATFLRLTPACVLGFVLITLAFYLLPGLYLGRGVLAYMFLIAAPGLLLARLLYFKSSRAKFLRTRILFLGAGPVARECSALAEHSWMDHKFQILGYVPVATDESVIPPRELLPLEGSLAAMADVYRVDEIVVAVQNRRGGALPIRDLLTCKLNGVKVTDSATFFEREACQIRVDSLQPSWLVFGGGFDQGFFRMLCKKTFDLTVSVCVLIIALPILLLTSLCIYLEDRGPIFYRQERVGKDGRNFMVLKFRSMRADAEGSGTPQWASTNDPRTTRVGRIIRLLRIDEFPQILNVLKGDMSFVGPRPERPYFVNQLCEQIPYYDVRHSIKPGITGMAQVRYQYGASVEDALQKLQYDLYYVKNNSLFLDLLILIDTLQVVLLGKGGR